MNLFATVLTYPAPTANYRGESELNRTVIQKITDGRFDYPIISPEAIRNALREILARYGLPSNRSRLHDEEQLAVYFKDYPNPEAYVDDFLFGYLVAAGTADRRRVKEEIIENESDGRGADLRPELRRLKQERDKLQKTKGDEKEKAEKQIKEIQAEIDRLLDGFRGFVFKRDSLLRMNLAKALEPYRHNALFTQSPIAAEGSAYQNAPTSALLHRETAVTAFQYPFALNLNDCRCIDQKCKHSAEDGKPIITCKRHWTRKVLDAIGELNDVSGNHARSYYEMAPASIVVRLTECLVAGYETYGFKPEKDRPGCYGFPEVIDGILHDPPDYPGGEFFVGGKLVKEMADERIGLLRARSVTLERDPRRLLEIVADKALGG